MKTGESRSIDARRRLRLAAMLGATALAAPFAVTPALAQGADEASVDSNTIIVTAQRRAEALEDVPMTVTVVTPTTLANAGVNSIRDLAAVTTGFQVSQGGSYPQPAIRGVTALAAGSYENNVAVFVDGLYQTTPQIMNFDLPSVQGIQVLKGPQGTLYGRNATGGAILIDTIDPGDTWTGMLEATYGRFDDKRARAFAAGPLTEGVGLSLAGTFRRTDGYIKKASRTTPGQFDGNFLGLKQESLRAKLKFDLSADFSATVAYSYARGSDARGILFTPIENVPNSYAAGTGRETRPQVLGAAAGDVFDLDLKQHEASLKLEWNTGIGKLRSVTGFTQGKLDTFFDFGGSYVPDSYSASTIRDRTWQESVDLSIDAIQDVDLIVGGTYYNIKTQYDGLPNTAFAYVGAAVNPAVTTVPLSSYRKASETDFFRTKEAWALFGDITFHATDKLSINVGGRYSKETQDVSGEKRNYSVVTGAVTSVPYTRTGAPSNGFNPTFGSSHKTSDYSKFTPRASIRYEITPGTNVYASYSKGFRGGEWNSVIPSDNPNLWFDVKQESVDAYEVGLKSGGGRLRFELAGFYYKYKDLQVSFTQLVPVNGVNTALVVLQNAPSAKIYGLEGSVDYEVVDNFNIRAGAAWLHARYGDQFYFTGSGVNPAGTGFNTNSDPLKVFPNITVAQDLSGLQMSRAPNFSGYVGFDYLIPQGEGGLRFAANAKYTDSYVVTNPAIWGGDTTYNARLADADTTNNGPPVNTQVLAGTAYVNRASEQRARQGAFVLINASVTWTDPSNHYYVRAWGNNLTNKKYRIHYNPIATGTYQPQAEPLTFGGTVGYKF